MAHYSTPLYKDGFEEEIRGSIKKIDNKRTKKEGRTRTTGREEKREDDKIYQRLLCHDQLSSATFLAFLLNRLHLPDSSYKLYRILDNLLIQRGKKVEAKLKPFYSSELVNILKSYATCSKKLCYLTYLLEAIG